MPGTPRSAASATGREQEGKAALGTPAHRKQLCCFSRGYATVLFPNNMASVMFNFIPNPVCLVSVSGRNRVRSFTGVQRSHGCSAHPSPRVRG